MEIAVENNRKTLEGMTVKKLLKDYATPLNITGRHNMKKAELIQAILMTYASEEPQKFMSAATTVDKEVKTEKKRERKELTEVQKANKMRYIEKVEIGTIVAFKLPGMKVKSAKVVRKSTKNRKFKVETTYGADFVISFDDVIWVKTNKRWPKGVYNLLKGKES